MCNHGSKRKCVTYSVANWIYGSGTFSFCYFYLVTVVEVNIEKQTGLVQLIYMEYKKCLYRHHAIEFRYHLKVIVLF
jgi:hypothetical protein